MDIDLFDYELPEELIAQTPAKVRDECRLLCINKSTKKYEDKIDYWISEPDKGVYDAMNKGIKMCSADVVGMINSDDFYELDALEKVAKVYEEKEFDFPCHYKSGSIESDSSNHQHA